MTMPDGLYRWICTQNNNLPLIGLVTFSTPKRFVRSILEGNREKSLWNGKKACVTLSFDCDYPDDVEAIPAIVDMLKPYNFKASFAAVGYWVQKFPKEHALVIEHGHELMNHTYSHPDNELLNPGRKFRYISRDEKMEELMKCHEICKNLLGYEPIGMRVPHFKHLFSDDIYEIIKEAGFRLKSSKARSSICRCCAVTATRASNSSGRARNAIHTGAILMASGRVPKTSNIFLGVAIIRRSVAFAG